MVTFSQDPPHLPSPQPHHMPGTAAWSPLFFGRYGFMLSILGWTNNTERVILSGYETGYDSKKRHLTFCCIQNSIAHQQSDWYSQGIPYL